MYINTDIHPVRLNANEQYPVRWYYRGYQIGIVYEDNLFRLRAWAKEQPPVINWPVFHYQSRQEIATHLNKLLQATCYCIDRKEFPGYVRTPYTRDHGLLKIVERTKEKYRVEIKGFELTGVIEARIESNPLV